MSPCVVVLALGAALSLACKSEHDARVTTTSAQAAPSALVPPIEGSKLYAPISDDMLKSATEAAFARDPALRSRPPLVSVSNGVVALDGTVPTLAAKWRAAQLAGELKGAISIKNEIRVSPPMPAPSDREIVAELNEALQSDPATRSAKVEVTSNHGTLILRGTADSYAQRDLLGYAASRIRGVLEVDMGVTLSKPSGRSDTELAADITDRLGDDARLDGTRLSVTVHGRDTVLSGVVGSLAQQDAAVEDAWLAGAGTVDVRPMHIDWRENLPALAMLERPPQPTDAHIAESVRTNLATDIRVDPEAPTVRVEKGVVTLSGNVMDFRARNAAVQDAQHVRGVWRVEDAMTVLPAKRESDATIQKQVTSTVYNDPAILDARNLRIRTAGAKVTVQGAVASPEEKKLLEGDVEEVPGVIAVNDEVQVQGYGPDTHVASPESLRRGILEAIFWDPRIGMDNVTVDATPSGDVTLSGLVGSWGEAQAAADDAVKAGAARIDNRIRVVAPGSLH